MRLFTNPHSKRLLKPVFAILLTVAAVFLAATDDAAGMIASPHPVKVVQPDGTAVSLRIHGDEHFHWFADAKGFTVLRDAANRYVYANLDPDGQLAPTALLVGKTDPSAAGLPLRVLPSPTKRKSLESPALNSPGYAGPPELVPPQGTVKNLVILCKFADHTFGSHTRPREDYNVLFNSVGGHPSIAPTGSVKDYYTEVSYGSMTLQSTVLAWVTLPNNESYYADGKDGTGGDYPKNAQSMVKDALDRVDGAVDFGQFDQDNDGFVDSITIIHSGYASETGGGGGNWIWSHRWSLYQLPGGRWTSQDPNGRGEGVKVFNYHTEAALWDRSGTDITRIGVICHETGHFFGLPDLYDPDYSSHGLGSWCLMANSWGFDGTQYRPPHFSAWCKVQLGWVTPTVISSGAFSAPRVQTSRTIFKITSGFPSGEYLLLENRQPYGYDSLIPQGGGLAVWHIDESKPANVYGHVNYDEGYPEQSGWPGNNRHYRIALLQADGRYDLERKVGSGDGGDLYRAGGTSAITPLTTPNTNRYQAGNSASTNNSITDISPSGTTMTFSLNVTGTRPAITSAVTATGAPGTPFTYQISATNNPGSYGATGLPPGLSVNSSTGFVSGTPATAGTSTATISATNASGTGTATLTITIASGLTLAAALDTSGLTWTTGGDNSWVPQSATTHDGVDAAASGTLGDLQQTRVQTGVTGPGTLTFWWKVSSEATYDFLRFQLDGAETIEAPGISGTVDWQQKSVSVPAGSHTLRWSYSKDGSVATGSDAGWLDQVSFTSGSQQPVITSVTTASGTTEQAFYYQIVATGTPTGYSAAGLPPGLSINTSTGVVSGIPTSAGFYPVTLGATNSAGTGTITLNITISSGGLTLATALDAPSLTWITGTASWQPQTAISSDGADAARSGSIGNSQASWMQTTVTGPGTLTFWWKISSEFDYDFLRFYMDNAATAAAPAISGTVDWHQRAIPVPAGSHTLLWEYSKDISVALGSDAGWVDQVMFTGGGQPPVITSASFANATAGQAFGYQITAANSPNSFGATGLPQGLSVNSATGLISGSPGSAGDFTVTIMASNPSGTGFANLTITVAPAGVTLPQALDATTLLWTTGGASSWTPQTFTTRDGIDAARTGLLNDNESSFLETTVTGPGTLNFWWKVSSEEFYDFLRFRLDGLETPDAPGISGAVDWQQRAVTVPQGSHVLRWEYAKDPFVVAGADAGWLDMVSFTTQQSFDLQDDGSFFHSLSPATGYAGQPLTIQGDVRNNGTGICGGFTVKIYASADANINSADALLATVNMAGIGPGTWANMDAYTSIPASLGLGSWYVGWILDSEGGVSETDEFNNIVVMNSRLVVTSPPVPEIALEQPAGTNLTDGSTTVNFGSVFTGMNSPETFTVRNNGTGELSGLALSFSGGNSGDFYISTPPATPVSPGGFTTFTIRFAPAAGGLRTTTLRLASNDADENPFDITLTGTGSVPQPEIVVEQPAGSGLTDAVSSVNFGGTTTGTNIPVTFQVRNTGPGVLTGLAVTFAGGNAADFYVSTPPATPVAAGGDTTFTIRFAPASAGVRTTTLRLANNDPDENPFDITITGTGLAPAPEIAIEQPAGVDLTDGQATADFGTVPLGAFAPLTFTVKNTGTANMTGLSAGFSGGNAGDFAITSNPAGTLPAGGSTSFTVRFTPTATGLRTTMLRVASNDANENPFDITLTGFVPPVPEISVEQPVGTNLADGAATVNFGSAVTGTNNPVTFTVRNSGGAALGGFAINFTGANPSEFFVSTAPAAPLDPGGSTTFTIRFAPAAGGIRSATLRLASNDLDENPFDITLTGTGIPAAPDIIVEYPPGVSLVDGAASVSFGSVLPGVSEPLTFAVRNNGTATLTGLALSFSGDNTGEFSVSTPPATPVDQGGFTTFTVRFLPTGIGPRSTTLRVASNDPDEHPFDIILTGTGAAVPEVVVEHPPGTGLTDGVSTVNFGGVIPGENTPVTFSVRNSGTGSLTGLAISFSGGNASEFYVSTPPATPLDAGGSTTFTIRFAPAVPGVRSTTLRLASNDTDENPFDITLTGNGVPPSPEITVQQPAGTELTDGLSTVDFGTWLPGAGGFLNFTVRNTGTAGMTGIAATFIGGNSAEFTITAAPAANVAAGGSTAFTVRFVSGVAGLRTTTLRIASNDSDENPFDVALRATVASVPEIVVEQQSGASLVDGVSSVNFGTAATGTNSPHSFTVRNAGAANLTGLTVSFSGGNTGDFFVSTPPAAPVMAGSFTAFTIRFAPAGPGTRTTTLRLASNDADENPFDITLTGTGFDQTPPSVIIGTPADGAQALAGSITVSGTAADDASVSLVKVRAGSGTWIVASGTASWSATVPLAIGLNVIEARAVDTSGNESPGASRSVTRILAPVVEFAAPVSALTESGGTLNVSLKLSHVSPSAVTVPFTVGGSAMSGTDFTIAPSAAVTIPAGQTTGTVALTGVTDSNLEGVETIVITLGTPTGATSGPRREHRILVSDAGAFTGFEEPARNAASYIKGSAGTVELGWTSTGGGVRLPADHTTGGIVPPNKYFRLNNARANPLRTDNIALTGLTAAQKSALVASLRIRTFASNGGGFEAPDDLAANLEGSTNGTTFASLGQIMTRRTGGTPDNLVAISQATGDYVRFASAPGLVGSAITHIRIAVTGGNDGGTENFYLDDLRMEMAGAADPLRDTDGDGQTDVEEAVAGTDPASAASILKVNGASLVPGGGRTLNVSFSAVAGKIYQLESSATLNDGWSVLVDNYTSGITGTVIVQAVLPAGTKGFVRIRVKQ